MTGVRTFLSLAASALAAFSMAPLASAQVTTPAPGTETDATTAPAPTPPKKVCRNDAPTGSHLSRRVCKTVAEWNSASVDRDYQVVGNRTSTGRNINLGTKGRTP